MISCMRFVVLFVDILNGDLDFESTQYVNIIGQFILAYFYIFPHLSSMSDMVTCTLLSVNILKIYSFFQLCIKWLMYCFFF